VTSLIRQLARKPILARLGLVMAAIVALAVVSMLTSAIIAKTMEGMATAINQAGSLRMQSYRIGVALADDSLPPVPQAARAEALVDELEDRLRSPRLRNAIPEEVGNPVTMAHARVARLWREELRAPLREHLRLLAEGRGAGMDPNAPALPRARYLAAVDDFVEQIDTLVRELEEVAEGRVATLRLVQWTALVLTVIAVLVAMALVIRRVILPLQELLGCADRARRGDFSGRTRYTGDDELGRLGAALNLMAEGLSEMYGALEQRVEEKTRDLARSNHSLDLLYRTSKALNEAPVTDQALQRVLADIQGALGTGPATLCLAEADPPGPQAKLRVSTRPPQERGGPCQAEGCTACRDSQTVHRLRLAEGTEAERCVLSLPVRDRDRTFGVLLIDLPPDCPTEPWQERLLEALAGHIGIAVNLQQRTREGRRLVLHEERTIIARELHDSLAQSLSYLKIQVTRLAAALKDPDNAAGSLAVLEELREGISSAYRQLRELLTTFRLKVDERGLSRALEATVQEYRDRGTLDIRLDNALPSALLSPNEEIHVLQIVREALSNVTRHARARHAGVSLALRGGQVQVLIEDDGQGIARQTAPAHHYGMTIMRERALSLAGALTCASSPGGGTRIQVRFPPRQTAASAPADPARPRHLEELVH
jgi:two-component system, NarL family, nitrate/nitrite sensor histidine kinase NarX